MEERLKQRLVGATVLVALAVIFVPMLLDGEGDSQSDTAIPPKAEQGLGRPAPGTGAVLPAGAEVQDKVPAADAPAGAAVQIGAEREEAERANAVPVEPAGKSPAEAKPVPAAASKLPGQEAPRSDVAPAAGPTAWVVQVASFSREENALALRDKLRAAGYTAFIERLRQPGEDIFRVRIGPEVERARAEALRDRLEREIKAKGIVQQHP